MTLLIKNGKIITHLGKLIGDIFIDGQEITAVGEHLSMQADRVIDASGKLVIPGGVDMHTHMHLPVGNSFSSDDFESGTKAAAFGGTTTIIDFAQPAKGRSLSEALDLRLKEAEKSVIDYGFHMVIIDLPEPRVCEMDEMVKRGITSFKLFTAYPDRLMANEKTILRVLQRSKQIGGLAIVHAEDAAMIDALVKQFLSEEKTAPKYHAFSRPPTSEANAVKRIIELARQAEAPVYFVHISCSESLEHIKRAQSEGQAVYAETCPQYLFTSLEDFGKPNFEDAKFVFTPPPREKWNQEILWNGLQDNSLQVVSTDHCPFNFRGQKEFGKDDFTKIPNGAPGIENRLQLLYHFGVLSGKISLYRWVELTSTNPAKLFGIYPKKGAIAVGSDADIVIWNQNSEQTISAATHHTKVDYNIYEGWTVKGKVETVILRGDIIVDKGEWLASRGRGKFLKRSKIQGQSLFT